MINIYDISLYYIGFNKSDMLENNLKKAGFKNVNHFKAIDARKMNPMDLLNDKIISIRAYNDLVYGREQHVALSSLGTVGCTLSHLELWKKCANELPFIIIAEDDVVLKKITPNDEKNIQKALSKANGAFISAKVKKGNVLLWGLQFYFLTNGAAKQLVENAMPIDLQTDCYVGNLNNTGKINAEGYIIASQSYHTSSTAGNMPCVKCILPTNFWFYFFILAAVIIGIVLLIMLFIKKKKLQVELDSCRSGRLVEY